MQNLLRLSLYRAMDFYSNPYKTCRQMVFEGCASKCSWTAGPMDEKFTAILEYDKHPYGINRYDFVAFCRHSIASR